MPGAWLIHKKIYNCCFMRGHFNYLLWLRPAGNLHWKTSIQKGVGRDWEAKMVPSPSQQSALGSAVLGVLVCWGLMFAVENRMCDGGG